MHATHYSRYSWLWALVILMIVAPSAEMNAQKSFSRADSLRGSITSERAWWDVGFYQLDLEVFPEKKEIAGSVGISFRALQNGSVMQVDLQPPLTITRVTSGNTKLAFSKYHTNVYHVELGKELQSGAVDSIRVFYSGHPIEAKNPPWDGGFQFTKDAIGNHFIATSCQGLGASAWWPNKDHSSDEPDSMRIRVTVPDSLIDVSNGRLVRVVDQATGRRTFEWKVSNPINNYGVNVNVAKYVHFADTFNGEGGTLDLDYWVLPYNLAKAKTQFAQVKMMLRAFEHWFGPYPFYEDGYKLVEVPYLGMEHQSSVTYGNRYQNGYLGHDLSETGWGLKWDFIIIHESGHEWFANNITYRDIADMWIHESFTNYSESLFIEYHWGADAATDYVVGTRNGIENKTPLIGTYGVNKRGSGDMYPKGGNMLHTIRHSIGDDGLFREILRGLNKTFYHQTVITQQIENFISERSGTDFSKVFDQYLRTVEIPRLEYYVTKKRLYYRWANAVDNFDLKLNLTPGTSPSKLSPTTKWKKVRHANPSTMVDRAFLERMYYITVNEVQKP